MAGEFFTNIFEKPVENIWNGLIEATPLILLALVLILVGYLIGLAVGYGLEVLLRKAGLDKQIEKAKLSQVVGQVKLSAIIGEITRWFIFLVFLAEAVKNLKLGIISELLSDFATWLPNLIGGILIIVFGIVLINIIAAKIEQHSQVRGTKLYMRIVKMFTIIAVILTGLKHMRVQTGPIENMFLIFVGAIGLGLAIMFGLGFGLGLKDDFKREGKGMVKDIKEMIYD